MAVSPDQSTMVWIYRFELYDVRSDSMQRSMRWGTRAAIERIRGLVIEASGREVEERHVLSPFTDIVGLTNRGFNPDQRQLPLRTAP